MDGKTKFVGPLWSRIRKKQDSPSDVTPRRQSVDKFVFPVTPVKAGARETGFTFYPIPPLPPAAEFAVHFEGNAGGNAAYGTVAEGKICNDGMIRTKTADDELPW